MANTKDRRGDAKRGTDSKLLVMVLVLFLVAGVFFSIGYVLARILI